MIEKNTFGKQFGPVGSISGITIFVVGFLSLLISITGLLMIVIGAVIGFTSSGTLIDFEGKRVKYSTFLFGFVALGKWMNVKSDMKIGVKKSNLTWRSYSRSNRVFEINDDSYIIVLCNAANQPTVPLKRAKSAESARTEVHLIAQKLGIAANQ